MNRLNPREIFVNDHGIVKLSTKNLNGTLMFDRLSEKLLYNLI